MKLLTALALTLALTGVAHAQFVIPNDQVAVVKIEAADGGFLDSRYTGCRGGADGCGRPVMAEDSPVIGCEVNARAPLWIEGTVMTRDGAEGSAEISVTATMGRGKRSLGPLVIPVEVVAEGGSEIGAEFVGSGLRVTLLSLHTKPGR